MSVAVASAFASGSIMQFIPLYYKEKLDTINPEGDVGVVTLWSPLKVVRNHLQHAMIDLHPDRSRIAVLGTLYGDGLPQLLRNLLYNPQIRYLVLFGVDLGNARESLLGFFQRGLEATMCLGTPIFQIIGTNQKMDGNVHPSDFQCPLTIIDLGVPNQGESSVRLKQFFAKLSPANPQDMERRAVPMSSIAVTRFPSDPRGHQILANSPLMAWKELIFRLYRFGVQTQLSKGSRIELQNVKVILDSPMEESEEILKMHGFERHQFLRYQQNILSPDRPVDQEYGYGYRLRGYFGENSFEGQKDSNRDTLDKAVALLKADPESRQVYIALWDTCRDFLTEGVNGTPCLVSLFFRFFEGALTLTAVFRTHNALRAWLENVYGLMAIQRFVAEGVGMPMGSITIISHSITIDPAGSGLEQAQIVCNFRNNEQLSSEFRRDPHGDFLISVDEQKKMIVVDHRFEGHLLHQYVGRSAEGLSKEIFADLAVSDLSHAMYLGRELGRAEARLQRFSVG